MRSSSRRWQQSGSATERARPSAKQSSFCGKRCAKQPRAIAMRCSALWQLRIPSSCLEWPTKRVSAWRGGSTNCTFSGHHGPIGRCRPPPSFPHPPLPRNFLSAPAFLLLSFNVCILLQCNHHHCILDTLALVSRNREEHFERPFMNVCQVSISNTGFEGLWTKLSLYTTAYFIG